MLGKIRKSIGKPDRWHWTGHSTRGVSKLWLSAGAALALHHKLAYGRWRDEKLICHGKIGAELFLGSLDFNNSEEIRNILMRKAMEKIPWKLKKHLANRNYLASLLAMIILLLSRAESGK